MQNKHDEITVALRQEICRRHVENTENWLRSLANHILKIKFGGKYITENDVWKKELRQSVTTNIQMHTGRFNREIEATTFEQIIYIVCHPSMWSEVKLAVSEAYPDGAQEMKTFLNRIKDIRNDVSHGRVCNERQMERAICYSNDICDSIKNYFTSINMNKEFNVPKITQCRDNLGNNSHANSEYYYRVIDFSKKECKRLYPGDSLQAEVDVDPSFDPATYDVTWILKTNPGAKGSGNSARIEITNSHVGERLELQFRIKTHADWHRNSSGYDDIVDIYYTVLPPV